MSPKMVYGGRSSGRRVIAAVDTLAEFMRLTGHNYHEAKHYGGETGNPVEVQTALAHPHVALYRSPGRDDEPFRDAKGNLIEAVGAAEVIEARRRMFAEDDAREAAINARPITIDAPGGGPTLTMTVGQAIEFQTALADAVKAEKNAARSREAAEA